MQLPQQLVGGSRPVGKARLGGGGQLLGEAVAAGDGKSEAGPRQAGDEAKGGAEPLRIE